MNQYLTPTQERAVHLQLISDLQDKIEGLESTIRAIYALAGEDPQIAALVKEALDG